jgi:hypothetical protein
MLLPLLQVWRNDVLMKSTQLHSGSIFTTGLEDKWLFTGGWDKVVKVQVHMQNTVYVSTYIMKFSKFAMLTHFRVHSVIHGGIWNFF